MGNDENGTQNQDALEAARRAAAMSRKIGPLEEEARIAVGAELTKMRIRHRNELQDATPKLQERVRAAAAKDAEAVAAASVKGAKKKKKK